jgi:hypothetical protein
VFFYIQTILKESIAPPKISLYIALKDIETLHWKADKERKAIKQQAIKSIFAAPLSAKNAIVDGCHFFIDAGNLEYRLYCGKRQARITGVDS